ncbi:unnamed protein product [Sphenostylis stenocarpa]|uniref:Protein kinase domain-containing protein n=1 Tax=Sphenostylis stenocarpa TaxID=92480 RepID=A0AA86ST28_9FABA|nr:unnamed protein product [Sphenostylis stenocarpa]
MKVMLTHPVKDVCSPEFVPTYQILNNTLFQYSASVDNITIFFDGCPDNILGFPSNRNFKCGDDVHYFEEGDNEEEMLQKHSKLRDCKQRLLVPTAAPLDHYNYIYGDEVVREAISDGFEVYYDVPQHCKRCNETDGSCWNGGIGEYVVSCKYCSNEHCSSPPGKSTSNLIRKIIIGVASAAMGVFMMCIIICCSKCMSSKRKVIFWMTNDQDIEVFLKNHGTLAQKIYKFSEVKKMTNNFSVKLGEGGFGVVYKGEILNGYPVAVKILSASKGNGQEFINEVASISRTSHVNVVQLLGFCLEGKTKALIYEYMANGSLDKFISNKGFESTPSLSWDNLLQIAKGIAQGLDYLHKGCNTRIFHFDIKPHNILLDEDLCPKISDFGLAKLCPAKESTILMSDARGTIGYVAPEVFNKHFGGVSQKSDVYSYGMMLLEMVGARNNINLEATETSEYFPDWIYRKLEQGEDLRTDGVIDTEEKEIERRMIVVSLWCIQTFPKDRPTMSRVIDMLEGNMNSQEMPPKPLLSSPTTRSVPEWTTSSLQSV